MATRRRLRALAAVPVVVVLGLAAKRYSGPGHLWVNDWGPASVAYECLFMLLAFIVVPRKKAIPAIGWAVCLLTVILEIMQLWHAPWLQAARCTFLGRSLLGTTFSWWDFPAYVVGCALGAGLLYMLSGDGQSA